MKKLGRAAVPRGQETEEFDELCLLCGRMGLWIVPVGEMEGFQRSIGRHGPDWVRRVMEGCDLATDPGLEDAPSIYECDLGSRGVALEAYGICRSVKVVVDIMGRFAFRSSPHRPNIRPSAPRSAAQTPRSVTKPRHQPPGRHVEGVVRGLGPFRRDPHPPLHAIIVHPPHPRHLLRVTLLDRYARRRPRSLQSMLGDGTAT